MLRARSGTQVSDRPIDYPGPRPTSAHQIPRSNSTPTRAQKIPSDRLPASPILPPMTWLAALLRWLLQLPPLQAMQHSARYLPECTLMALVDAETLTPRDLTDDYLRFLHHGVSTAATPIEIVVGPRASERAGLPSSRRTRAIPELRRKA